MKSPIPLINNDTFLIDNSSLEVFTTCARAAEYQVCQKRQSAGERSPLMFGKIIHEALDCRYRAASEMHAQTASVEAVMLAKVSEGFSNWQPPEDDFRTHSFAVELINKYGIAYPFESFEVLKTADGKPFVEVPFALPLGEIEINSPLCIRHMETGEIETLHIKVIKLVWTGTIDLVYRNQGQIYVLDHKTTSMMGPSFFSDFELSHAMHGYCWAVEQLLGESVYGYVINALATRKPTRTGTALQFERKVYTLNREHLDEWKTDCIYIISDFLSMAAREYFPKHTKWCFGKYGQCQFHKICTLPPQQREIMLNSGEFQDVTWSPLTSNK